MNPSSRFSFISNLFCPISTSSTMFLISSLIIFISLFSSLFIQVGPFVTQYYGTQMIPHPNHQNGKLSYAIVIDAGSTGTRIHIFSFIEQIENKIRRIYLEKESFHYTTPGLSSYSDDPSEAVDSLKPLINQAVNEVPDDQQKRTSLILKATAGLRLLPEQIADFILGSVKSFLFTTKFKVEHNSVSILNGNDEGIYAWYTVNFLLEKLHNISSSIVTMDLGGGSTQITFASNANQTLLTSPREFIIQKNIEGEMENLYTHSYLGFGLMSARKHILLPSKNFSQETKSIIKLSSPCFSNLSPNQSVNWKFQHVIFEISKVNSINSFEKCYKLAQDFVVNSIHKPEEIKDREIYLLSYYFDRMADVNVIQATDGIGFIKVKDYLLMAEEICNSKVKLDNQSPFLCLDLTYISALLHDGFGINWDKKLTVIKKINNIETSWALGAAINLLNFEKKLK